MYTVSKGPSKIVAKTRRGIPQNYEKFETIKESGKRSLDNNSPEKISVPRPTFQNVKKAPVPTKIEENVLTPQHEEIVKYINESWNIVVAQNPYDATCLTNGKADSNNNSASVSSSLASSPCSSAASSPQPTASIYCVEPPSPVLRDFQPFDLESWWGRRLFNNITKNI